MSALPPLVPGTQLIDQTGAATPFFQSYLQQMSAGVTNSSGASMPAPAPVSIYADYTGAYLTGQLPRSVGIQRILNGDDVSSRTRWFLSTVNGSITATIDQTGLITITALGSNSVLQVKSVRDGVTLVDNFSVNKVVGTPPTTGSGGGASASVSAFNAINSTTHAVIAGPLTVTVGASGNVTLNAPLDVTTGQSGPQGSFNTYGKWQWYNGTSWVDVAAEVAGSPCIATFSSKFNYDVSDGSLTVNTTKTGLTVGATAQFKLLARNDVGTRTMTFSGTASVIP